MVLGGCPGNWGYEMPNPCEFPASITCFEDQDAACAFYNEHGTTCIDDDGDCFPSRCEDETEKLRFAHLIDCEDANADIHPMRPEWCNAQDDDCDTLVDEGYQLGGDCEGCEPAEGNEENVLGCHLCGLARMECSVLDPTATACSNAPGQSDAPDPSSETCDTLDNDCDRRSDESCLVPATEGDPILDAHWCGEDLLTVNRQTLHRGPPSKS